MIAYVNLFGEITYDVTLKDVVKQLGSKKPSVIHVKINSPGGSVTEGRAVRNYLLQYNAPIITEAFGECSSIATEIFLAGRKRIVHDGIRFLVHRPYGGVEGNASDMASTAIDLQQIEEEMINLYMLRDKLKRTAKQWFAMLSKTTVFGGKQLQDIGFATELKKNYQNNSGMTKKQNLAKAYAVLGIKPQGNHKALDVATTEGVMLEVVTEGGAPAVGDSVIIKDSGGLVPPAGPHTLENGVVVVLDDNGIIMEIQDPSSAKTDEDPNKQAQANDFQAKVEALEASFKAQADAQANEIKALTDKVSALVALLEQSANGASAYKAKTDFTPNAKGAAVDITSVKSMINSKK